MRYQGLNRKSSPKCSARNTVSPPEGRSTFHSILPRAYVDLLIWLTFPWLSYQGITEWTRIHPEFTGWSPGLGEQLRDAACEREDTFAV
jgi:hypothetical protein